MIDARPRLSEQLAAKALGDAVHAAGEPARNLKVAPFRPRSDALANVLGALLALESEHDAGRPVVRECFSVGRSVSAERVQGRVRLHVTLDLLVDALQGLGRSLD